MHKDSVTPKILTSNSHGLNVTSTGGPPPVFWIPLFLLLSFFFTAVFASFQRFLTSSTSRVPQLRDTAFTL